MEDQDRIAQALSHRYRIEGEIGAGGMATVYLATDLRHERRVALKVLRPDLAASLGAQRFLQEVRVTAKLQHPHILPLFDSGEADGFLFYVMPYIEGESLRERLDREHELPVAEAARLLRDVVDALAAAHRMGVVHRDIKPENILISGRHAMVADFGVAKAVTDATGRQKLTTMGVALGTPSYMAPEQAAAEENIDQRADIYAVGAMAYELLTGQPPFSGGTPQQILAAQVTQSPQPPTELRASVPPDLETLIMGCLEKRPADRWQSAEEMLPHLDATITSSSGRTPTDMEPVTQPSTRTRRRSQARMAGTGVLAVAALAVGYFGFLRDGGSRAALVENRVAVMPFENRTGREDLEVLGDVVADVLTEGLIRTGIVEVVPTSVTIPFSREAGPGRSEIGFEDGTRNLAEETQAGTVVRGAFYLLGDSLRIQAEIIDEEARSVRESFQVTRPVAGRMDAIGEMRQRVLTALAVRFDPRLVEGGLAAVLGNRLPRYEAYEARMRAYDATFQENQDNEAIIRHSLRAFELDSTYSEALTGAVYAYLALGQPRPADSLLQILESHEGELSQSTRLSMRVHSGRLHGDLEAVYLATRDWIDLIPSLGQGLWARGYTALQVNRPREALEALLRADPDSYTLRGEWGYWISVVEAYHLLGRHEEELAAAREGRKRFPKNPFVLRSSLVASVALGREEEILAGVDELITLSPASPVSHLQVVARELLAHGYADVAREVLDRILSWYEAQAPSELETETNRYDRSITHYLLEDWDEAEGLFIGIEREELTGNRTTDLRRLVYAPAYLGAIAAQRGDREEALRRSRELAEVDFGYLNGLNTLWRGRIAAVLGDREEAMALLLEAHAQGQPFGWSWHRDESLESLQDYAPFQEFMRPKG